MDTLHTRCQVSYDGYACMQEKKLAELAEEFSMSGKQAHRLIANALPGGFSSIAIKKNLARLGLSDAKQHDNAAGSDDSDDGVSDGDEHESEAGEEEDDFNGDGVDDSAADPLGAPLGGDARAKKKATWKQRKQSKKLFDAIAKRQRAAADGVPEDLLDDEEDLADASMEDEEALQSASDDDVPGATRDSDKRKRELKKLAKQQRKPRAEAPGGKGQKAPPARKRSPKKALAAALEELVVEAQEESGGVYNLPFCLRETNEQRALHIGGVPLCMHDVERQ